MIPQQIPIFPLPSVVLFPEVPLPLHIFEPRYRRMVKDAMESHRVIGMTLLKPGWDADYQGRPPVYDVGCAGTIAKCEELAQGRYNILLKGAMRFRIREEHAGEPYRVATVDALTDLPAEAAEIDPLRKRLLSAIAEAKDGPRLLVMQAELPHDVFVNALSQSLPLSPLERQSLLDCDRILERYQRLLEILHFHALEETLGRSPSASVH